MEGFRVVKKDLIVANRIIGSLTVSSDARELTATRTVDGLALQIPGQIDFGPRRPLGYVTEIHLTVFQEGVEVGSGREPGFHWGEGYRSFAVVVHLSARAIGAIERVRNGGPLRFRFKIGGKTGVVTNASHTIEEAVCSVPLLFEHDIDVEYSRDRWIDLLRSTMWGDNFVTEVSLPVQADPPWDEVWRALKLAREALDRGGPTGWKACISECRSALEKWRDIEPLDTGTGAASNLTRKQRLDVTRQAIHRYAHDSVHSLADTTTRAEAVMVLGTVSGLLGIRWS